MDTGLLALAAALAYLVGALALSAGDVLGDAAGAVAVTGAVLHEVSVVLAPGVRRLSLVLPTFHLCLLC
jgi:hypothetical protein